MRVPFLFLLVSAVLSSVRAYDASSSDNVVVYWGQASAGSQERLSYYCQSDAVDVIVLSFLMTFYAADGLPEVNFANACSDTFTGTTLLKCDTIAEDIQTCQSAGKKVLLSLGGAAGSYGFSSDDEGTSFANTVWDMFGAGTSDTRPFGSAVVDGFDLDIENGNSVGYAAFANQLRTLYAGGDYYISAAPQCPFPDASIGDALDNAWFDFVFIQFYNNYCGVTNPSQFNYDTDWQGWVSSTAKNKDVKLFVGVPGSSTAAGSGYATPSTLESLMSGISDKSSLGGVMIWDASQSFTNMVGSLTFVEGIKDMLGGLDTFTSDSSSSDSSESTSSSSSSSSSAAVQSISISVEAQNFYVVATTSSPLSSTSSASVFSVSAVQLSSSISVEAQNLFVMSTSSDLDTTTPTPAPTSSSIEPLAQVASDATTVVPVSTSSPIAGDGLSSSIDAIAVSATSIEDVTSSLAVESYASSSYAAIRSTTTITREVNALITATQVVYVTTTIYAEDSMSSASLSSVEPAATATAAATVAEVDGDSGSSSSDCSGLTDIALAECDNTRFATISASDSCTSGAVACVGGLFAKCDYGAWVTFSCPSGTICVALPNDATSIVTCDTESDVARIFGASSKLVRRNVTAKLQRSITKRGHSHHSHRRRTTF